MATLEELYPNLARTYSELQKGQLRSLVEADGRHAPEALTDSLRSTDSFSYSGTINVGAFLLGPNVQTSVDADGEKFLFAGHGEWRPSLPVPSALDLLGPGFVFSNASGSLELNRPIHELVDMKFNFVAIFTSVFSSIFWQGEVGEHIGAFAGSPLSPASGPAVSWGSGVITR